MAEAFNSDFLRIGYFNWFLVAAYIVLLGAFLYGVLRPRRKSEWKSAGAAQAWVIALYAEMYGTPLTAYLVMGWLGRTSKDAETHFNGLHVSNRSVFTGNWQNSDCQYAQPSKLTLGLLNFESFHSIR